MTVEIAWCPGCRADCLVEIVTLPGDPAPVAICVDCGLGMEICVPTWWSPGFGAPARSGIARAS